MKLLKIKSILERLLTHPIGQKNRVATLLRFMKWQILSRVVKKYRFRWVNDTQLIISAGMTGATGNYYCGLLEYQEMSFVVHALNRNDVFLDIGANVGVYTILAAKLRFAKVVAVEPDEKAFEQLEENIKINCVKLNVITVKSVVSERKGEVNFTKGLDVENKVINEEINEEININYSKKECTTVDLLMNELVPKIIKIDVEGHEQSVILGALRTLRDEKCRAIIIETVSDETSKILIENNFIEVSYFPELRIIDIGSDGRGYNRIYIKKQYIEHFISIVQKSAPIKVLGNLI